MTSQGLTGVADRAEEIQAYIVKTKAFIFVRVHPTPTNFTLVLSRQ